MTKKTKTLYKFMRTGLLSEHGTEKEWGIGEWRKEDGIEICKRGFHASQTPLQALGYVQGEILAQVEVRGESVIEKDKECWSEMRVVKAWHWTKNDSVELAIFAAEQVIDIFEKKYPNDKRPREAIEAAKAYLKDPSDKNAQAAWAEAAARAAEEAVVAAEAVARAAAWAAARAAARAAEAAARAAEEAVVAAWAVAWAAEAAAWADIKTVAPALDKWFIKKLKTLKPYDEKD